LARIPTEFVRGATTALGFPVTNVHVVDVWH
jgi:hypothetical protein